MKTYYITAHLNYVKDISTFLDELNIEYKLDYISNAFYRYAINTTEEDFLIIKLKFSSKNVQFPEKSPKSLIEYILQDIKKCK